MDYMTQRAKGTSESKKLHQEREQVNKPVKTRRNHDRCTIDRIGTKTSS